MATNIPPHNLREVIGATIAYIDDPEIDLDGLMRHVKGPDFPTGGIILGAPGHPRRVRDRPWPRARAGQGSHRAVAPGQGGDRRHRAAVHGQEGRRRQSHHKDRRTGQRQAHTRDLRPARRVRQARHASRDRAQARRDPQGGAEQALQAHLDADHLRREHGGARGQRAAHAEPARGDPQLRGPPARSDRTSHQARARREGGARAHPPRAADRAREPRRDHRLDPRLARPRSRTRTAGRALRADG